MSYIKSFMLEFKRMCDSKYLIYGVIGICVYMSVLRLEDLFGESTMYILVNVVNLMGFILVIMIAYEIYGNVFIDDFDNKYIYQVLMRNHNVFFYTLRKTFWIFLSAMVSVAFGMVLYTLTVKLNHIWSDETTAFMARTPFGQLYVNEHYVLYVLLAGLQFGILAGMMSVIGSLVSLFVNNKIFAGAITVISVFACNLLGGYFQHAETNIFTLFSSFYNQKGIASGWIQHCIVLGMIFYCMGSVLIYLRIKWRLRHE